MNDLKVAVRARRPRAGFCTARVVTIAGALGAHTANI